MGEPRRPCAIPTRLDFWQNATPIICTLGGKEFELDTKEFSTGSLGWHLTDKARLQLNGQSVHVQLSLMATIIGSKDLPRGEEE